MKILLALTILASTFVLTGCDEVHVDRRSSYYDRRPAHYGYDRGYNRDVVVYDRTPSYRRTNVVVNRHDDRAYGDRRYVRGYDDRRTVRSYDTRSYDRSYRAPVTTSSTTIRYSTDSRGRYYVRDGRRIYVR